MREKKFFVVLRETEKYFEIRFIADTIEEAYHEAELLALDGKYPYYIGAVRHRFTKAGIEHKTLD